MDHSVMHRIDDPDADPVWLGVFLHLVNHVTDLRAEEHHVGLIEMASGLGYGNRPDAHFKRSGFGRVFHFGDEQTGRHARGADEKNVDHRSTPFVIDFILLYSKTMALFILFIRPNRCRQRLEKSPFTVGMITQISRQESSPFGKNIYNNNTSDADKKPKNGGDGCECV